MKCYFDRNLSNTRRPRKKGEEQINRIGNRVRIPLDFDPKSSIELIQVQSIKIERKRAEGKKNMARLYRARNQNRLSNRKKTGRAVAKGSGADDIGSPNPGSSDRVAFPTLCTSGIYLNSDAFATRTQARNHMYGSKKKKKKKKSGRNKKKVFRKRNPIWSTASPLKIL